MHAWAWRVSFVAGDSTLADFYLAPIATVVSLVRDAGQLIDVSCVCPRRTAIRTLDRFTSTTRFG